MMSVAVANKQHAPGDRVARGRQLLSIGAVTLVLAVITSLAIGPTGVSFQSLPRAVLARLGQTSEPQALREKLILLDVRLPRVLLAVFVGGALAVAGTMMQGLFRNPLADPGIIGVSSGAALAAVTVIALGNSLAAPWVRGFGVYALPAAAFLGGFATTTFLTMAAGRRGQLAIGTLLLTGIAVSALAGSLTGLIAFASDDRELRDLTLWTLGSLAGANWAKVVAIIPFAVILVWAVPRTTRALNGLLLGEAEAFHLGIDVERSKRMIVLLTAAAVGAAVAVAGIIGFVGIIVPHLVRLFAGPDHRIVLPGSAILGAILVVAADIIARMVIRPAELPIGIIIAVIGAPVFLHLVLRRGIGGME